MSVEQHLLVRNRNFAKVWLSQVLSQTGSRAYFINLLWWIVTHAETQNYNAAWATGALLILIGLPSVVLVKPIGSILRRVPSKSILVSADLAGAILTSVIFFAAWLDALNLPIVLIFSGLVAVCQALVDPTLTHAVPELVAEDDVEGAVGLESSTQALAYFSGAALGAIASGTLGFQVAIALNIISYVASAVLTRSATFRASWSQTDASGIQSASAQATKEPVPSSVYPLLRAFALANCFMFPLFLILPLFVNQSNHGLLSLGLLEACFWLGLMMGAATAPKWKLASSHLGFSAKLFGIFGLLVCTIFLIPSAYWIGVVLACGGYSAGLINVKVISYFQTEVPANLRASFFATLQAYVVGAQPLSYLVFTAILSIVTPLQGFLIDGLGLVAVSIYCLHHSREKLKN